MDQTNNERKTREQIIEALTECKHHDLEAAIEGQVGDYEIDLDGMTDDQLAKEYEDTFGTKVEIVAPDDE
jgi:hypothetical protein